MKAPDRIDVARKALGQVLTHPATWAPFVPLAGGYAFLGAPWWLCMALMLVVVVVICAAWSRHWPQLMDKTRTEMLTTYRTAENAELGWRITRIAQALSHQPVGHLLADLREAMMIKQAVENRLFADGSVTAHKEEIGAMISELVCTMISESEHVALGEGGAASRGAADRCNKAAATLRRAFAEIDVILDPVPEDLRLPATENDALSRASERLDERLQLARNVRRHLERDMKIPDAEPSADEASARPQATTES